MAQDLSDFFHKPPPPPVRAPSPGHSRNFSTPVRSSVTRGHQSRASATTFDDLLGSFDNHPRQPARPQTSGYQGAYAGDPDPFGFVSSSGWGAPQRSVNASGLKHIPELVAPQKDDEDEDEFGDFAEASSASAIAQPIDSSPLVETTALPLNLQRAAPPNPSPLLISSTLDDVFGDLITPPIAPTISPPPSNFHTPNASISLRSFSPSPSSAPPIKQCEDLQVPPVSTLLTVFPPIFLLPQTQLLSKLTDLPFPLRQRVLSHPQTKEFLEAICELGRVAGRIISGRKRRQKQTIAPAGGKGGMKRGMKLGGGGVTAWEMQKEDREVKEICRLWKDGSGRLRAAMGLGVPEILDAAHRGSGGIGGDCCCQLCGLAKSEIVAALKEKDDGMGWWDAQWGGHRSCRAFWEKHGMVLKSRQKAM